MYVCKYVCPPVQPSGRLVAASKAAVPTVSDPASALQLGNFAKSTAAAVAELRNAASKVRWHTCVRACVCVYMRACVRAVFQETWLSTPHTYVFVSLSTHICHVMYVCTYAL